MTSHPRTQIGRLLVANRGEIAVRVMRAAAEAGIATVAVRTADEPDGLHLSFADAIVDLADIGARAYLNIDALIEAAQAADADAVHPGYGFLSESPEFARRCKAEGIGFVGPDPEVLATLGDKAAARRAAAQAGVPVLEGFDTPITLADARALLDEHGAIMLKAVAGGGGRGMRAVANAEELEPAWERCVSEATSAFGQADIYAERLMSNARHIEVQVVGDRDGNVVAVGERECSIQRRHQKLLEIAPAPHLNQATRDALADAAVAVAREVGFVNLTTMEFLIDAPTAQPAGDMVADFRFIEANARIQVEHTVTEAVFGLDLVTTQLRLAEGAKLSDLPWFAGHGQVPVATGMAAQARVYAERITAEGQVLPATGVIQALDLPTGPGVRVDSAVRTGTTISGAFDPLLAKVIVHHPSSEPERLFAALTRALRETHITGLQTNIGFMRNLAAHEQVATATTRFVDEHLVQLATAADDATRLDSVTGDPQTGAVGGPAHAGAGIDHSDPLAVLDFGRDATNTATPGAATSAPGLAPGNTSHAPDHQLPPGAVGLRTPLQGTVVAVGVNAGDSVKAGALVAVVEAMKMEHEVRATATGVVTEVLAAPGDTLLADQVIVVLGDVDEVADNDLSTEEVDLDEIRPSLARLQEMRARMMDSGRPDAVARRHDKGHRTARENVADLVDEGTFVEYGPLALAAQRRRRTKEDLIKRSPADGLITGVGSINGDQFDDPAARCAVMVYDYTVFAGTQGIRNHAKTDRIIDVAVEGRMPFVLYAEGGGGRPGDTDGGDFGSRTFSRFATMSGLVPMVGVVNGRCFAGNASLLGVCDVIIATKDTNLGMGGPAMIEGGGLGVFRPEEIGPAEVHVANGVIDVLVEDEAEATAVARQYLSYFQGPVEQWEAHDPRLLRHVVPENRLRSYNIRDAITYLADVDSVLELRAGFGHGMVTALIRVEGKPMGVIANNPNHLGGAIDSDASDKAARFMQLCDAFDLPIVYLCDTPGIMVGPEVEKTALVRHSSRIFLIGANLDTPTFTIVLRKSYGLGGIAMAGGSYQRSVFSVAWPTAEFGPMGLEGSVKLGFRAELEAKTDPAERKALFDELVAKEYERGGAINYSTGFAIDDTIDPADTRFWLTNLLAAQRPPAPRDTKKRSAIDAW